MSADPHKFWLAVSDPDRTQQRCSICGRRVDDSIHTLRVEPLPSPPSPSFTAAPTTPTRNEWRLDDAGQLDDVVVDDVATFRLERMSASHVWGAVYRRDGSRTDFNLHGKGLTLSCEHETSAPVAAPPPQETPQPVAGSSLWRCDSCGNVQRDGDCLRCGPLTSFTGYDPAREQPKKSPLLNDDLKQLMADASWFCGTIEADDSATSAAKMRAKRAWETISRLAEAAASRAPQEPKR